MLALTALSRNADRLDTEGATETAILRISQGARYTSDFTPSLALRADGDTLALWSMDEGSGADLGDGAGGLDGAIDGATWSAGCAAIDNAAPGAPGIRPLPRVRSGPAASFWSQILGPGPSPKHGVNHS